MSPVSLLVIFIAVLYFILCVSALLGFLELRNLVLHGRLQFSRVIQLCGPQTTSSVRRA